MSLKKLAEDIKEKFVKRKIKKRVEEPVGMPL